MTITLEQAKKYIEAINFTPIINKMTQYQDWRLEDADSVCRMYRNFLFLQKKYGEEHRIVPSEEIDEFWHNHILDTQQYQKDCEAIFGHYLHHYPYLGIDGKSTMKDLQDYFEQTQVLYKKEFAELIVFVRGKRIFKWLFTLIKKVGTLIAALSENKRITKGVV